MKLSLSLEYLLRSGAHRRKHLRLECQIAADLHFLDDGLTIKGYVNEVSQGGLRFKPNQTFIMRRHGATVRVLIESKAVEAVLRNTTSNGYGVAFLQELDQREVDAILAFSLKKVSPCR